MTDTKPSTTKPVVSPIAVKDVLNAPIIYLDGAPNFGCNNGIVNVTLATSRHLANGFGGVESDVVAVAHLRCTVAAAQDLIEALNKAVLIGVEPAGGGKAN